MGSSGRAGFRDATRFRLSARLNALKPLSAVGGFGATAGGGGESTAGDLGIEDIEDIEGDGDSPKSEAKVIFAGVKGSSGRGGLCGGTRF